MFKPDATYKKLAQHYHACAYVYPDGVMLIERRDAKAGKYSKEIEVNHFWPCEIRITSEDYKVNQYGSRDGMKCKRLVIHNPLMLLSGLESVRVAYESASEHSREKGLHLAHLRFSCPNGMQFEALELDCLSGDVTVQPNYFHSWGNGEIGTLADAIKYSREHYENVEIHGTDPTAQPEAANLQPAFSLA